jgi:UDP:flavonoid glycosyltransferase YjiC (YdhE family)
MGLAAELIRRGHSVHVLADPTVCASAVAAGCGFTPWPTAPSVASVEEQTAMVRRMEQGPPWRRYAAVRDLMLAGPAGRFADDVPDHQERNQDTARACAIRAREVCDQ